MEPTPDEDMGDALAFTATAAPVPAAPHLPWLKKFAFANSRLVYVSGGLLDVFFILILFR